VSVSKLDDVVFHHQLESFNESSCRNGGELCTSSVKVTGDDVESDCGGYVGIHTDRIRSEEDGVVGDDDGGKLLFQVE
jgi:hypothetical protein